MCNPFLIRKPPLRFGIEKYGCNHKEQSDAGLAHVGVEVAFRQTPFVTLQDVYPHKAVMHEDKGREIATQAIDAADTPRRIRYCHPGIAVCRLGQKKGD